MPWGDSSKLKVAEWVLAIGNPYQLSETVTLGIVSAVGRTNLGVSTFEDFIQTDAAINPGQLRRRADQRSRRAGRHQHGHLLAQRRLSGHRLRRLEQPRPPHLRRPSAVRRGAARLDRRRQVRAADHALARRFGAPDTRGALVYRLYRDSPAYRAGIDAGDIVVAFNGTAWRTRGTWTRLMSDAPIGSTATLASSGGQAHRVKVPIQKRVA